MDKPKCEVEGCKSNKRALVMLGSKFICTDCFMRFSRRKQESINELLKPEVIG